MKKIGFLIVLLLCFSLFALYTNRVRAQSDKIFATVGLNPLNVEVISPAIVSEGERFFIEAKVENSSQHFRGVNKVEEGKISINYPSGLIKIINQDSRNFGTLQAGKERTIKWNAVALEEGSALLLVEAEGKFKGEKVFAEDTSLINIISASTTSFFKKLFGLIVSIKVN